VSVFISGARLKPGEYELRISGDLDTDAANAASPFVLVIRKH
jgi:protein involved in polysaccharide export with SLBB domain